MKPSFMRELLAYPSDRTGVLWEKINILLTDPFPDGKVKKKLVGSDSIYRLRVADHRVLYQFGEEWISLLGLRRRSEATYERLPDGQSAPELPPDPDEDLEVLLAEPRPSFRMGKVEEPAALPIALSADWLKSHQIPVGAYPHLLRCRTEEDLLNAPVSPDILSRVLDALFPPRLDVVVQQPDLVVPSAHHLVQYKEGDLLAFLLKLDVEQIKLTQWALSGPTMVRGSAGTGKSTVALYRVKAILERPGATGRERVLFTTYTRALLAVTQQLLEQILTREQLSRVRVATCDQVAREIVAEHRKLGDFESDTDALKRLEALRKHFQVTADTGFEARLRERALARLSDVYLLEELDWILEGRGITTLEEYKAAPRPGRGVGFADRLREVVWSFYQAFRSGCKEERFVKLRGEALSIVQSGNWRKHWDAVFVDEAQDLSPVGLALMAEVCKSAEGLFFAADSRQSLYSRSYSWTSAHPRLQFRGRTAHLKRNYRTTREIDRAASKILRPDENETWEPSSSIHDGPLPVLVRGIDDTQEAEWVVRFIRQMSRHLHLNTGTAAVLVPTASVGRDLASRLGGEGLEAAYFSGTDLDLKSRGVKVMTLHAAKGLEFPIAVLCGFHPGTYPSRSHIDDEGLFEERALHARRLIYVGMTRAMRGLMVVLPRDCEHPAFTDMDLDDWHLEAGNGGA